MSKLISIIIPIYNMECFIETCINSVLSQTHSNIEIILVNDGSSDNSSTICSEIALKYPNVVFINQKNKGVSAARNAGMDNASGDYLLFLDADDTIPPDALETLLNAATQYESDMTIGKINPLEKIPLCVFEGEEFLIKTLEDNPITYYACRILYKQTFIQSIRFVEGIGCSEDSYFVFECALHNPKVATVNEQVYNYYTNPTSATRSAFTKKRYTDICYLLDQKEIIISKNHKELLPLFYHLKTKIQMMLLTNLCYTSEPEFKRLEKETLARFNDVKGYFKKELPYSNVSFYNVLCKKMYYPYKIYARFKKALKSMLRK